MKISLCVVLLTIAGLLTCLTRLNAQTVDELKKQFPDEKAVMLNKLVEYNISLKNGKPYVESHEAEQIEYLLGNATIYSGAYGFSHSDFQQLISYQAYTRTADDKKLKVSEFKTASSKQSFVFYDDVKETTFNFPAVQPGAIGNLEVSYLNKDPHLLSPFYFTGYFATANTELKLNVSKDISLKYRLVGLDTNLVSVSVDNKHHNNLYTFKFKNSPADRKYPDAPGFAWYSPHVVFYIANYKDDNGATVPYLSNADDLYRLNYDYVKKVNNEVNPALKHIVDSLSTGLTTPELKARSIYSWVQQHIKYIAFENGMEGFVPRDAGLICSRRFGDCKDMASILTEMLNVAGLQAYFTWIGTRDLPYSFTREPLPLVSNHMICAVKLNGQFVFLDGTDPTCVFGMPSSMIQDKEAMISISDKEYKIVKVPAIDKNRNTITDTTWMELSATGIKGTIKRTMNGYFAMEMYGKLMYWSGKDLAENMKYEFERGSNNFHLDTFAIGDRKSPEKITLSANFTLPGYAKKIGGDYYLNLNLFRFFENEQIDYPRRKMPIAYDFKFVKKYVTILKVPKGYKFSDIPPGKIYHNKVWGFDMSYTQKDDLIILTQQFENDTLLLTSDKFQAWNQVLENLLPLYKETLSLSKN